MGNRGQKRTETVEELPADKRVCNSLEFRPSSSNSSVQTHMNSTNSTAETGEHDMDTSSSASASSRSEGEPEKDSTYGSCDSDDAEQRHSELRDYQRRRSSGDHGKFKRILSVLSEETEESGQLVVLTELCEVLSFCTENSLSSMTSDSLSPYLVRLSRHETNPEIMLLAIRAITYLCDVYPRSSGFLVRHDAVPALCQRLLAIEYLDVAEQCLQALEKISREQPLACLQAGAIMAVLSFIDFFSTSMQRVALSTVMNICKKLPSECPSPFMEAVPILCNLLQYEDKQLVEIVALCLIRITERVRKSSEMLDELCKHGLIQQTTHFINSSSRTTLSLPVYNGLLGVLVKLSSGSVVAFKTLFELNISSILKDALSNYDISHGVSSPRTADGQGNQVYEVLNLINALLPTSTRDQDAPELLDKESFLKHQPDLLKNFGMDVLPLLIQVVNSGANLYISFGCLFVINKLIHLSPADVLVEVLKNANFSSFLAGVFTRKDPHILILALKIAELVLQKLSDIFLDSFIKEGVLFAIDALLKSEKCPDLNPDKYSQLMVPVFCSTQFSSDSSQKSVSRESLTCLCYTFASGSAAPTVESNNCKLEKDSVYNLAKHIRTSYFSADLFDSDKTLTDVLQELKSFSLALNDLSNISMNNEAFDHHEERFYDILCQVITKLSGSEPISTFEFIESGIVKSLINYLSDGQYLSEERECCVNHCNIDAMEKRFAAFAKVYLLSSDSFSQDFPLSTFILKLQNGLSSLEAFPVVLNNAKMRSSFAAVPSGRCIMYPSLTVRFVRGEGETGLSDYTEDYLTADPFSSVDAIEGFLWPKVKSEVTKPLMQASGQIEKLPLQSLAAASSSPDGRLDDRGSDSMLTDLTKTQAAHEQTVNSSEATPGAMSQESAEEGQFYPKADIDMEREFSASSSSTDTLPNLLFFLDGQLLERDLTLYQAIIQKQIREHETVASTRLWSQVYTLTYKKSANKPYNIKECSCSVKKCGLSDAIKKYVQQTSFSSSMFTSDLASDLEKPSPTYDIMYLLKCLERMNRFRFHLISQERMGAFAEGKLHDLDRLKISAVPSVPQNEFVSSKLTEKLEQQMRDRMAVSIGGMPSWCSQIMASCPFLFSFEARCKYFRLGAFGQLPLSHSDSGMAIDRRLRSGGFSRKKFLVSRDSILESAKQMMELHARYKGLLEVAFNDEVGTGIGPTLEFFTLVSHEFQKTGLGMWRDDHGFTSNTSLQLENQEFVMCPLGLFPRPWSSSKDVSDGIQISGVMKNFELLGQIVAKALHNGRVLDLHFSKAFYKLILGQELGMFDILSFDPELGRTLLEFKALAERKLFLESTGGDVSTFKFDTCFRNTRIEDLSLNFTLPGYPDFFLASGPDYDTVTMRNLEKYVSLVVDATLSDGISRQTEAFKLGFNQVFPLEQLQIFTEEELERLLCGEHNSWAADELIDQVKFDHGYTASSPPVVYLLEIIQEFDKKQQRAFLQFVTGAPRLPPGGLASLNPKLTIVRKHCSGCVDADLPSVMTCANYLKLPPYSSKERMKEKLLYAITEGQGSFHLS
ncbi:E3 ubiquitin-protein ligase UPL4 isoform X2 [Humulus lupulus]|uniref:E3 ubiquitin-protein ligase UPL4 isoform X2 n=1 Tax=Humulus lupulus TaxID=3486 RepID=UPI002B413465|nr:E3 ubiquitin-protein ligase UPL4 isoform X2 [Humulus lupulus]